MAASLDASSLILEAQNVMALRMWRMAQGGAAGQSESRRMVTEKMAALAEAHAAAATAAIAGGDARRVGKKVLNVYKKRVRGNRRRLTRSAKSGRA